MIQEGKATVFLLPPLESHMISTTFHLRETSYDAWPTFKGSVRRPILRFAELVEIKAQVAITLSKQNHHLGLLLIPEYW